MEVSVIVECRETRKGAFTSVTEHDIEVTVEQFDTSGTGRHWKERVTGPVGAQYFVTDITNSGKDRSAWRTLVFGTNHLKGGTL